MEDLVEGEYPDSYLRVVSLMFCLRITYCHAALMGSSLATLFQKLKSVAPLRLSTTEISFPWTPFKIRSTCKCQRRSLRFAGSDGPPHYSRYNKELCTSILKS